MAGKINAATPAQALAARDAVAKLEKELQLYAQGYISTSKASTAQAARVNALINAATTALAPLNTGA